MTVLDIDPAMMSAEVPRFSMVTSAVEGAIFDQGVYDEALRLRADVYTQRGFIGEDEVMPSGIETDEDDERSVHLAVIDHTDERVVGVSRMIVKAAAEDRELPVEHYFGLHIPAPTLEASRFIANIADKDLQQIISLSLIDRLVAEAEVRDIDAIHAVIERPLAIYFKRLGISVEQIAEPREVERYNTVNMAVAFDTAKTRAGILNKSGEKFARMKGLFVPVTSTKVA